MDIFSLLEKGYVGEYEYCEVIQVILYINGKYWNYFTHIHFSSDFVKEESKEYLTSKNETICKKFKILVCREVVLTKNIIRVLKNALENQIWKYNDDEALLDEVFLTNIQFVPEVDSTGNIINEMALVPLDYLLYKGLVSKRYYIADLFSKKEYLYRVLNDECICEIQEIINKVKLNFDLLQLRDRIGNIVCKVDVEVIKHKNISFSPQKGIQGEIRLVDKYFNYEVECDIVILQENDKTILNNSIERIKLSKNNPSYKYQIPKNRWCNRINIINSSLGIIYYSTIRDYSFRSDYYARILPNKWWVPKITKRIIETEEERKSIDVFNTYGLDFSDVTKDSFEVYNRQQKWKDYVNKKYSFFNSFKKEENNEALGLIKKIINDKELLWDLDEIWLVDPYLSADDILNTVIFVKKSGVKIKCLTNLKAIQKNNDTIVENEKGNSKFEKAKIKYKEQLNKVLSNIIDINIEYRTVYGVGKMEFHDRYLICKYKYNKTRVWSLGISVNSLGKSHHIIQIVESPIEIYNTISEIWDKLDNNEDAKIFNIDI